MAASGGDPAVHGGTARRWAWIAVFLGAWIVGGVYLVSRALSRGDAGDAGISPYHAVAYTGLLVLVGLSVSLVIRAVRRHERWRDAFPSGFGSLGTGAGVLVAYVVLDVAWREGVGIGQGIEASFAPSRVILVVGLALVTMAPLRAALLANRPRQRGWPVAISAGLLAAALMAPGGLNPIASPWLEKAGDVVEDNAEIWLMDRDGGRQTRLVEAVAGVEALLPAWSPDGTRIAYARFQGPADDPVHAEYDIWVMNVDGTDAHAVTTGPRWQWFPRWSPDGAWIEYTDEAVGGPWLSSGPVGPAVGQGPQGPVFPAANAAGLPEADLWRLPAAGGSAKRITDAAGDDRSGSWSPDGTHLVFDSTRDGNTELYAVDVDGSNSVRLTDNPAQDWAAAWSPDGSRIAFTSDRTGIAQIWVMAADGSGATQLTDDRIGALWPASSTNGARILFTGWTTGEQQAWSMAADGTDTVNLSRSPLTVDATWDGSWGPDGRIVFSRVGPSPAGLSGVVREDLGAASMLIGALILALVVALLARTRPPFGAVALAMTISTALVASQSDAWRFVPAAAIAGIAVDVLLRFLPPERRVAAAGAAAAVGLVAASAGAVAATTGIGWSPTLLVGVGVAAGICGWAIGALIERHAFRGAPVDPSDATLPPAEPDAPLGMNARLERAAALAAIGIGLAVFQQFGPLLWPYGLGPSWSVATAALYFAVDLVWVAAMVATYLRDPDGRMWRLFLLYRVVTTLGVLWVFPTSLTWTVSQLVTGLGSVVFVHLVLAYPSGRLTDRFDRRGVAGAYAFLAISRFAWVLAWQPTAGQVGFAPRNPFVVLPNEQLAWLFGPVALVGLAIALFAVVVVGLGRHWRRASPVFRRSLLPITVAAPVQLGFTVAWYLAGAIPSEWGLLRGLLQSPLVALAGLVFPIGYLVGLVRARLARAGVAELAVELGRGVPLGELRGALARALRDPTLELAFPGPAGEGFVGPDGQPIELPDAGDDRRAVGRLERDGELLAVLVYDPAVEREDPGRVAAVGSVAGLALENERLAAQVRAQLEEVRASRTRIVEAQDAERRRIERDLHDGAQQRLVALAMRLDQARAGTEGASELIDATTVELLAAIREVRDLARGVHPPILTDAGLGAAIEALAERTPFPVAIEATERRYPPEVEAAAYFVVAEGLTNIARYADASAARVVVRTEGERLVVRVTDDGRGGADPGSGSGLRGLSDRLAAIGGELTVTSEPGLGTTLQATLPAAT